MYRCSICKPDAKTNSFVTKGAAERHIMERHSNFGWLCDFCEFVSARENGKHTRCKRGDRPLSSKCHNRITGQTGDEAKAAYEEYRKGEAQAKIVEIRPPVNHLERSPRKRSRSEPSKTCARSRSMSPDRKRRCSEDNPLRKDQRNAISEKQDRDEVVGEHDNSKPASVRSRSESPDPTKSKYDAVSDPSDGEHYVPRKVVSNTVFEGDADEVLSCPSTCESLSPAAAPRQTAEGIREITTAQLSKATDDLNQALYDKYKLIQDGRVTLNVGGKVFETSVLTLRYDPSSILAIITNRRYGYDGRRNLFIDQDPTHFHVVLNYLRNGGIIDLSSLPRELGELHQIKRLCINLRLDGLLAVVNRRINNIGCS